MSRSWLALFGVAVLGLGGTAAADPARSAEAVAVAAHRELRIPGMALVVARGDTTLLARGFGVTELGGDVTVTSRTVFQLGSISKQFLAALVVQLAEEGALRLDDAVVRHLPEFSGLPPTVELRHLLDHTSGIRELFALEAYRAGIEDLKRAPEELVAIAREAPVDFPPGSRWSYSNTNYTMLALIVERLLGLPYEEALRVRLFEPLGLASLRQCTPLPSDSWEARGHVRRDGAVVAAAPENMGWIRGDGGLCGHAEDVARWTRLLNIGRVLSRDGTARMTAATTLADGRRADYGFGLSLAAPDGVAKVVHGGAMLGFTNMAAYYPESESTVVVLTNLGGLWVETIERDVARAVLGLPEPEVREVALSTAERGRLAGRYDIGVFEIEVIDRDGALWLEMPPPGPSTRLRPLGGGVLAGEGEAEAVRLTFQESETAPPREVRLLMAAMHWYGVRR